MDTPVYVSRISNRLSTYLATVKPASLQAMKDAERAVRRARRSTRTR